MIRSVFAKGVEALLIEAFTAAHEYGIVDLTMENLAQSMDNTPFENKVNVLLGKTAVHSNRRIHEMEDVIKTLNDLNVDPTMSTATLEVFETVDRYGLKEYFSGETPKDYKKVLKAIKAAKQSQQEK